MKTRYERFNDWVEKHEEKFDFAWGLVTGASLAIAFGNYNYLIGHKRGGVLGIQAGAKFAADQIEESILLLKGEEVGKAFANEIGANLAQRKILKG